MLPLHHHGPNVIVLLSFTTPTIGTQCVCSNYLEYTKILVLLYCFVEPFFLPDLSSVVYTCTGKKFSAHGTVSSYVEFQNIVIVAALPRVRWHRASSPQGSSSNGCCLGITMDQMLLCASLFPHPLLVYSVYVQIIGSIPKY